MLEKIKIIWKNKALILAGFLNKIFKRDPVERVYNERIKICKKCEAFDEFGAKCVVPKTQPCCGICGCSLSLKLRSLDSLCPHPNGPMWDKADM